ncbi:DUF1853 family protein [Seonamhaeicola sp. ML3]|uniref:DUF1853 family protein n=1 Tax=Seonamhaeicola sp. ML3 TaxID=2937786 RepID=UPI00200E3765|nr:DUF1853 family protein [Seonamhaeicola sp. ML3]
MLQKRYEGFLKTPVLWKNDVVFGLKQFNIESTLSKINISIDSNLRLGKYIERFVSFQLQSTNTISIITENLQIQKEKITLGELDCIIKKEGKPIHLEIIYKFYVYDPSVGHTEIEHCVGPNRKDTLIEKLLKLKEKQLPLLFSETTKSYLDKLELNPKNVSQQVYFKAQLFLPYKNQNIKFQTLNNSCIAGFYISKDELMEFWGCKFYIPNKKDWLVIPHPQVEWLNFDAFKILAEDYYSQKFSPLCWLKFKNGTIKKMFLVWW